MPAARFPEPGPEVPRTHGPLARALGRWVFRAMGWSIEGNMPNLRKFVIIVAPHTSNWDFPVGAAAKLGLQLRARFLGKDSLFRFPLGIIMRGLGGTPVDRSQSNAVVSGIIREFEHEERLVLVVAPEGTRRRVERWKTGFYHIARGAGVPIVPVAFDWAPRKIVIGDPFTPTGDVDGDVSVLQRFFAGVRGRNPENTTISSD